jgi:hypothetical protein
MRVTAAPGRGPGPEIGRSARGRATRSPRLPAPTASRAAPTGGRPLRGPRRGRGRCRRGRPVRLLPEGAVSHFDEGPLPLVTTASLAALADHRRAPVSTARLRPNLLVEVGTATGFVENRWTGQTLAIGSDLVISIREPMPRCVMVDQAQHGPSTRTRPARHDRSAQTARASESSRTCSMPAPPASTTRSNSSPDQNQTTASGGGTGIGHTPVAATRSRP